MTMSFVILGRSMVLVIGVGLLVLDLVRRRDTPPGIRRFPLLRYGLAALAILSMALVAYLFANHVNFPLNLEVMEGTVLQHFERASHLKPIYPEMTPAYVPLAYNPLYYFIAVPAGWIFGVNLFTLRLVAILAVIGSAFVIYRTVKDQTDSAWWALIAVGLFAAAYRAMDAYLDTAHSDSWMLFLVLLGSYILGGARSPRAEMAGIVLLVAAFWTKQHGALFAMGGMFFLMWRITMRDGRSGFKRIAGYGLVVTLLGPGIYILAGPALFGPRFHYFTWEVPSRWSRLDTAAVYRYGIFVIQNYLLLALGAVLLVLWTAARRRSQLDIWQFQFPFALLSGGMGALDPGSSNNVFVPMGTWFILVGTLSLHELAVNETLARRFRAAYPVSLLALLISFGVLFYDPLPQITSSQAQQKYREMVIFFRQLDANIYSPDIGQLQRDFKLYPNAHWVAMEDLVRGPSPDANSYPVLNDLLLPLVQPARQAYIVTYKPLEARPYLEFLTQYYVLEADLGDCFEALETTPHRWTIGYPRYLYRFAPELAAKSHEGENPAGDTASHTTMQPKTRSILPCDLPLGR